MGHKCLSKYSAFWLVVDVVPVEDLVSLERQLFVSGYAIAGIIGAFPNRSDMIKAMYVKIQEINLMQQCS